jgi:23S rRNA (adenine-N6)-dimethyltransferase
VAAPARRWGWHQLADRWAATLVAEAQIAPHDLVIDVGAGTGAITHQLVQRGAQVLAVELHHDRAVSLRARFDARRVTVIVVDAADLRLPRRPFRVVANPPFSVTTALLKRLTAPGSRLVRADLVVPTHVARRWARGDAPGANRWRREFIATEGRSLPRSAFTPPPPHGTAVLTIRRVTERRGLGRPGAGRRRQRDAIEGATSSRGQSARALQPELWSGSLK